jgi:microcin C transport system ATP-binding protein
MKILSVEKLNISTSESALVKDVSFTIEKGEILALVGESGSGKTLTALSIMGLLPGGLKQSGDITVTRDTQHVTRLLRGKDIGMIFQEPMTSLNPLHTIEKQIGECVRIGLRAQGAGASKKNAPLNPEPRTPNPVRKRVCELLDKVGLAHFKDRLGAYPHQLSGGERQRVMIAMAIANNPQLLIADEPTTALDVTIQAQILALLHQLQRTLGMSVLLITHDLNLVKRIADRVVIMSHGAVVECGTTEAIFANAEHPYTKQLLAAQSLRAPQATIADTPSLLTCDKLSVTFSASNGVFAWKKFYHTVLRDITLGVPQGATLGIVGESGSGKSTLALALLRLTHSTGSIVFEGAAIDSLTGAALRAKRRHMQIVFQDPYGSLNPRMSIGRIIREGLDVHEPASSIAERWAQVDAILQEVGLTVDMKERYPHEFSGGQRQRISIARALILKPRLIVLDEPTSALDTTVQAQILELLKSLQRKYKLSYIFISHDLRTVRAISHRIVVLQQGRVVESGTVEQIFKAPKADYTRALLAAAFV